MGINFFLLPKKRKYSFLMFAKLKVRKNFNRFFAQGKSEAVQLRKNCYLRPY